MHTSINISNDPWTMAPFADAGALRAFYEGYGCDGVELILCGDDFSKLAPGMVRGLHLIFYPEWITLWRGDTDYLDREFGSRAEWLDFYGFADAEGLLNHYRKELATAQKLGVEYVVFHMGDNALNEYYTLKAQHSAEAQIDESIAFLNRLFDGSEDYGFALLLENMWLGCMNLTRPELTAKALAGVHYPNTGLMLDTGHLMSTSPSLASDDEACAYIHQVLDNHGELAKKIRGVHLHASLSGDTLRTMPFAPPDWADKSYVERYGITNTHLRKIDHHRPFVAAGLPQLIARIAPNWLCYELSRSDMDDWHRRLAAQQAAMYPD